MRVNTKKIIEQVGTGFDVNQITPTQREFDMMIYRLNKYNKLGKNAPYIYTPWGMSSGIKDINKTVRYYIISVLIPWVELANNLKKKLSSALSPQDKQQMENFLNKNSVMLSERLENALINLESPETNLSEAIEKHTTLNPKLWDKDNNLKPDVKKQITQIVKQFTDILDEDEIDISVDDIVIIGSNASYNYTKDSDLDVHIIVKNSQAKSKKLYPTIYNLYRSIFNKQYEINFYGIPVEIYVETPDVKTVSNGCYSVLKNEWIKKPILLNVPEVDKDEISKKFKPWEKRYETLLAKKNITSKEVEKLISDIYAERKKNISKEGEFCIGNLIFKEFRNKGYLDKLKELRDEVRSDELSLEEQLKEILEGCVRLTSSQINNFKQQIFKISQSEAIIDNNGMFTIHNIKERDIEKIMRGLTKLPFIEYATKVATGYDFNSHVATIGNLPNRKYNITGKIKL